MGTLNYCICAPGRTGAAQGSAMLIGRVRTSAAYATSAAASDAVSIKPGEIFVGTALAAMWVNPYGTAVVGTGIYFPAGVQVAFEFDPDYSGTSKAAAAVSAIDV